MSTLTKICVVVLVVLVLLACPIFITQATIGPNYRHLYEQEQLRAKLFEQNSHAERLRATLLHAQLEKAREEIVRRKTALDELAARASRTEADLRVQITKLKGDNQRFQTGLQTLITMQGENRKRIDALTKSLTDSWQRISSLNDERIALTDRLEKADLRAESLNNQAMVLRETKAQLEREIGDLREQLARRPPGRAEPGEPEYRPAPAQLTATITAVRRDIAGINVGSSQGIRAGMKLMVHRGDQYVSDLIVREVWLDRCAGIITNKQLDPMRGDSVTAIRSD